MENASTESEEEGEIVEYEPIPRPVQDCGSKVQDISDSESDNDSDDSTVQIKKPKLSNDKRNKYNIWSSELQASQLMDELSCWDTGLKNKIIDRSRNVESYYYISPGASDKGKNSFLKRRHDEEVDLRSRLNHLSKERQFDLKSQARFLGDLGVTAEDDIEDVAHEIVDKLCEEKEDLVLQVVSVLGRKKAIDMFQETKKIEEEGGMLVMNGSRRRTPGGVFLQLIKRDHEISSVQREQIFREDNIFENRKRKAQRNYGHSLFARKELGAHMVDHSDSLDVPCDQHSENDHETVVKNPPPSPATDGEQLDDRCLTTYEDMFDLHAEIEMDL